MAKNLLGNVLAPVTKNLPPFDDQIRKHKKRRRQAEQLRENVQNLSEIVDSLIENYRNHKADCGIGRYEAVKSMIKRAVAACQEVVKRMNTPEESPSEGGLAEFARLTREICNQEQFYSEKSHKDIQDDLHKLKTEIPSLTEKRDQLIALFNQLEQDYKDAKRLSPIRRYKRMKNWIKNIQKPS